MSKVNRYVKRIYNKAGENILVDFYDVINAYEDCTNPALQHLVKKALCPGQRGHKDTLQDLVDIRDSAERAISLHLNREEKSLKDTPLNHVPTAGILT
jgi:hypothetical protein